jgi:DNA-binding transcriptional LysR family regulator
MLLRDLDFFILVAETASFRGAAAQADVTQPAITKGIKRLENELGLRLFERDAKGTALTDSGAVFLKRARRLRNDLNDALREASDLRSRALGLLRVGVAPTLVDSFFRKPAAILLGQRPAARFSLQIALSDELFFGLRRGDLDVVLSSIPEPLDPGFRVPPLGYSQLSIVGWRSHPLMSESRVNVQQLVEYQWILPRRGVLARDWIDGLFARHSLPLPVARIELDTLTDALLPILVGTSLLSISSASGQDVGGDLATFPQAELSWRRSIGALTRADISLSPLAQHFYAILVDPIATAHSTP